MNKKIDVRTCKYCSRSLDSNLFISDSRICNDCVDKKQFSREDISNNKKKDLCQYCCNEFLTDKKIKKHICQKCTDESNEYFTTCEKCDSTFKRSENFNFRKFICDECTEAINCEEYFDKTYRLCGRCKEYKEIGKEISYKAFFCPDCIQARRKERYEKYFNEHRKFSWPRKCPEPNCGKVVMTTKPKATIVYCEECRAKKNNYEKTKS
jgi:hypothetical protein